MRKVQRDILKGKGKDELVSDLRSMKYSILSSIGYKTSKIKIFIPRFFAFLAVLILFRKSGRKSNKEWRLLVRKRIVKILERLAPYTVFQDEKLPKNINGVVLGFNHPSLGEILRLIGLVCKEYPENNYLFPVTLPWFEVFCPIVKRMEDAGIYLTPIVTPSTREKIEKECDKEAVRIINSVSTSFNAVYINLCRKFAREKDVILVAPPATRQAYIFKTDAEIMQKKKIEPQTMSLLSATISRDDRTSKIVFIPIAVAPPKNHNTGVNLFESYAFGICDSFTLEESMELSRTSYGNFGGRAFDYDFLARIAVKTFKMGRYEIIAPFSIDNSMDHLAKILGLPD